MCDYVMRKTMETIFSKLAAKNQEQLERIQD